MSYIGGGYDPGSRVAKYDLYLFDTKCNTCWLCRLDVNCFACLTVSQKSSNTFNRNENENKCVIHSSSRDSRPF